MKKYDRVLKDFGAKVKALRIAKGVSQEEFAHLAQIDRSYYGRIERSEANLTLKNIVAIADCLNVTVEYLFSKKKTKRSSQKPSKIIKSSNE